MFGGSVTLTEDYGIWWSYITHFIHVPGYVYAYAFGDLLVRALYAATWPAEGTSPTRYLAMLAAGGSDWPRRSSGPSAWTWPTRASGRRGSRCWKRW